MIRPGTGAQRQPKFSNITPKATNYKPKIINQGNVPDTFQLDPQFNLPLEYEYNPDIHDPCTCTGSTLQIYNYGPHLELHQTNNQ